MHGRNAAITTTDAVGRNGSSAGSSRYAVSSARPCRSRKPSSTNMRRPARPKAASAQPLPAPRNSGVSPHDRRSAAKRQILVEVIAIERRASTYFRRRRVGSGRCQQTFLPARASIVRFEGGILCPRPSTGQLRPAKIPSLACNAPLMHRRCNVLAAAILGARQPHLMSRNGCESAWWALTGSNRRPSRCKRDALPAELTARAACRATRKTRRQPGLDQFADDLENRRHVRRLDLDCSVRVELPQLNAGRRALHQLLDQHPFDRAGSAPADGSIARGHRRRSPLVPAATPRPATRRGTAATSNCRRPSRHRHPDRQPGSPAGAPARSVRPDEFRSFRSGFPPRPIRRPSLGRMRGSGGSGAGPQACRRSASPATSAPGAAELGPEPQGLELGQRRAGRGEQLLQRPARRIAVAPHVGPDRPADPGLDGPGVGGQLRPA